MGREINNYYSKNNQIETFNVYRNNKKFFKSTNLDLNNIQSDINNIDFLRKKINNIDTVIHLAFPNNKKNFSKKEINYQIKINNNFFNLMIEKKVKKFIYLSTSKIKNYENYHNNNLFNYEICKLEIEKNLKCIAKNNDLKLIILRPGIIYGPNNNNNLSKFVNYIKNGNLIPFTSNNVYKNIIFIQYFLEALNLIIQEENFSNNPIYLYEKNISIFELMKIINKIINKKNNYIIIPRFVINILKYLKLYNFIFKSLYDSFYISENSFYEKKIKKLSDLDFENNLKKSFNLNKK